MLSQGFELVGSCFIFIIANYLKTGDDISAELSVFLVSKLIVA